MTTGSLIKQPAENRLYSMDFSGLLAVGEVLAGVTSVTALPADITLSGAPSYSGVYAMQRILGGTANTRYKLTFVVTTSAGNTLEGEGYLQVKDI
jgi:hypothetical protein